MSEPAKLSTSATEILGDWRIGVMAVLTWLLPFLAAIPFISPDGGYNVPEPLFKSIMVVISTAVGVAMLIWAFRRVPPSLRAGLVIGIYWLLVNWALDLVVLLPLSGMSLGAYFNDIGLRYLSAPIIAAGIGYVAGRRSW
jgi:hypothetical protein